MKRKNEVQTIQQAFNQFISDKELKGVSKDTIRNYRLSYRLFIQSVNIDELSPISVLNQSVLNSFISNKISMNPISLNHYLRDLRTFFNHINIDIKVNMVKHPENKVEGYTDDEVKALLKRPDKQDNYTIWKCWLISCIILGTGARIGSVVSLGKQDINYQDKTITFPHTKNGKTCTLPLTDTLINCIKAFENTWDNTSDWLIPNFDGTQSTSNGCHQAFDKYCVFVQIVQKGIHALRHTFARLSIQNGMDIYTLNRYLGHSDIRMTQHYINIYGANLNTTAIPLDKLMKSTISRRL